MRTNHDDATLRRRDDHCGHGSRNSWHPSWRGARIGAVGERSLRLRWRLEIVMGAVRSMVLAVLTVVAMAACGSDPDAIDATEPSAVSSPAAGESDATTAPSSAAPDTEADPGPATVSGTEASDDGATSSSAGDGDGFCDAGSVLDSSTIDLIAEPDVLEEELRAALDGYDQLVAMAPPEFEALVTSAQAYQQGQFDVLEANGFDFESASASPEWEALGPLGDAFFAEFGNVEAALTEYCGL